MYFSNASYCFSTTASHAYKASPNYLNIATDIWREDGTWTVKTGLILFLTLGQAELVNSRVTVLEYLLQYLNTVLHNNRVTYTSSHHTTYFKYCKAQVGFDTSSNRTLIFCCLVKEKPSDNLSGNSSRANTPLLHSRYKQHLLKQPT